MNSTTVWRLLALFVLGAIAVHKHASVRQSPQIGEYQARVREAAAQVPTRTGPWVGTDARVPTQALSVLKPNVMLNRRYVNVEDGTVAGFMIVHCANAHTMVGHFPLRCYPAAGWDLARSRQRDWSVEGLPVSGMEYEFTRGGAGLHRTGAEALVVENFLLRPGGRIFRDMDAMSASITTASDLASGAAQVQVYFEAGVPAERRDAAVVALLEGFKPVLDAILSDVNP